MKTTSPSLRVDKVATRSPDRSIAGPLVTRIGAPSSAATIIAIVVLPRPGGPASRTWSGGRPRRALDDALVRVRERGHRRVGFAVRLPAAGGQLGVFGLGHPVAVAVLAHGLLSLRSAARRTAATSTVSPLAAPIVPSSSRAAIAWS